MEQDGGDIDSNNNQRSLLVMKTQRSVTDGDASPWTRDASE